MTSIEDADTITVVLPPSGILEMETFSREVRLTLTREAARKMVWSPALEADWLSTSELLSRLEVLRESRAKCATEAATLHFYATAEDYDSQATAIEEIIRRIKRNDWEL